MKQHDQSQKRELRSAARSLSEALLTLETTEEVRQFLQDLCTPAELEAMVDRWRVAQLLEQGLPYREIRDLTEVSVTTVGRVARFLERGTGGYRTALEALLSFDQIGDEALAAEVRAALAEAAEQGDREAAWTLRGAIDAVRLAR